MFTSKFSLLSLFILVSIVLSGCATKPTSPSKNAQPLTAKQRTTHLLNNKKWQLRGKIAFIKKVKDKQDRRESAAITWQVNEVQQTQELNLTSYLGINVLHLESKQEQHLLKVDGEEYRTTNLSHLITSLTGLALPTNALKFWLKGLPYKPSDNVELDKKTQLPLSISSYYDNTSWKIHYSVYQQFNGINMATKFTIEKEDLLIKIVAKKWSFDE